MILAIFLTLLGPGCCQIEIMLNELGERCQNQQISLILHDNYVSLIQFQNYLF